MGFGGPLKPPMAANEARVLGVPWFPELPRLSRIMARFCQIIETMSHGDGTEKYKGGLEQN